jgi:ribosomal protein S8E
VTAERERCQEQGDGRVTAEDATSCQGNDLAAPKNGENGKNLENGENTIPPTPQRGKVSVSRKRKSPLPEQHSEEGRRLAELLRDRILQNNPEHIPITEKQIVAWAKDADLMMRRDGRTEARIREVMDWSQQDKFWRANVLSMGTLRMQFDRLAVKVRDGNGATSQSRPERGGLTQGELEREIAKEERGRNATVAQ